MMPESGNLITVKLVDAEGESLYTAIGSNVDSCIRQALTVKDGLPGLSHWRIEIIEQDIVEEAQ
jgi:hypothetical protein